MFEIIQPEWIPKIGGAFALISSVILFLDLSGEGIKSTIRDLDIYVGKLDQTIEKYQTKPIETTGKSIPEVDEFNEMLSIVDAAEKEVEKKHKSMRIELLEAVQAAEEKHNNAQKSAIFLAVLGGILALI